jgi:hypothetical protein
MNLSASDKKWQKYNQKLEKLMKAGDFFGLGTVYYEMAHFAEEEGTYPKDYREQGYKMKLKASTRPLNEWQENGAVRNIEILGANDSCIHCKENNGKKQSIIDALENPLIPNGRCSHKYGCRCTYLPSF